MRKQSLVYKLISIQIARVFFIGVAAMLCMTHTAVAEAQAAEEYIKTDSGLQYADIKVGTGAVARTGSNVVVHYTGWLRGRLGVLGKKFDSSVDRDEPFRFALGSGQVIAGWDEGVQGMRVGGIRKLIVPAALGYGVSGAGNDIPPNAALVFEIELLGLN